MSAAAFSLSCTFVYTTASSSAATTTVPIGLFRGMHTHTTSSGLVGAAGVGSTKETRLTCLLTSDTTTLAPAITLNISNWASPMELVWAIFRSPSTGNLIVIGNAGGLSPLQIVAVSDPTGPSPSPKYLGDLPCVYCTDFTWDTEAEILYAISNEESQTSSGTLLGVKVGSSPPELVVNVTLQARQPQGSMQRMLTHDNFALPRPLRRMALSFRSGTRRRGFSLDSPSSLAQEGPRTVAILLCCVGAEH